MKKTEEHPDERTLELYVLKSDLLKARRSEIAGHLRRCKGCEALHREIEEYYAKAGKLQEAQAEKAAHALYAPDRAIRTVGFSPAGVVVPRRASVPGRFAQSIRENPVRWSTGFVVVVALALFLPKLFPGDHNPSFARMKDEFMVVYNMNGDEVWRKHISWGYDAKGVEGPVSSYPERALTVYDVDGDGTREVLAVFGWRNLRDPNAPSPNTLLCLNADGSERWRYEVHRNVVIGGEAYSDDYRIYQMIVGDFERGGSPSVIIWASQDPWFPNVIIRLNARDGSYVSEYWHPGTIPHLVQKDLNGDGVSELIMAGQNNRYGRACVLVLDPRRIIGYSPAPAKFIPPGMPKGQELFYVIFPPSDLKDRWVDITNQVAKLENREGGLIEAAVMEPVYDFNAEMYYYLDSTMACVAVRGSDHFTAVHKRYESQGRFKTALNEAYFENLRSNVLYWNGSEFGKRENGNKVLPQPSSK